MVTHFCFDKDNMPAKFAAIARTQADDLDRYFKDLSEEPFRLLSTESRGKRRTYNPQFKKYWEAATRSSFLDFINNSGDDTDSD